MKLLGITGGIAMGKSTSGRLLRQNGVPVTDADDIARQLVEPGQPALAEIRERFGPAVFLPDGCLDREALARQVFALPSAGPDSEAILHPRIRALWQAGAEAWRKAGHPCGAIVIPLLFETKAEPLFDATLCVACSAAEQAGTGSAGWDDNVLLFPVLGTDRSLQAVLAIEDPAEPLVPSEDERRTIQLLADQVAVAFEVVSYRNRLHHLANHDALTGVLNRRDAPRLLPAPTGTVDGRALV